MQSYAKVLPAAVHMMAGWGRDWKQGHWLGQARVPPPSSLLEQVLPGLHQMQSQMQSTAAVHRQLRKYSESVDMLYFLGTVFLQTLPLRLAQHGDKWHQVMTAGMQGVLLMLDWSAFQKEVMCQYAWGKQGLQDRNLHTICPGVATARAMTSVLHKFFQPLQSSSIVARPEDQKAPDMPAPGAQHQLEASCVPCNLNAQSPNDECMPPCRGAQAVLQVPWPPALNTDCAEHYTSICRQALLVRCWQQLGHLQHGVPCNLVWA